MAEMGVKYRGFLGVGLSMGGAMFWDVCDLEGYLQLSNLQPLESRTNGTGAHVICSTGHVKMPRSGRGFKGGLWGIFNQI